MYTTHITQHHQNLYVTEICSAHPKKYIYIQNEESESVKQRQLDKMLTTDNVFQGILKSNMKVM